MHPLNKPNKAKHCGILKNVYLMIDLITNIITEYIDLTSLENILSKKFIKNRLWRFFYAPTKFFKINSLISNKVNEITRLKDFFLNSLINYICLTLINP